MRLSNSWHRTMYDDAYIKDSIGSKSLHRLARKEVSFLLRILDLPRGAEVLDIPCGAGRHSAFLAKAGLRVTGMDINSDCLKAAKRNSNTSKNVKYVKGNIRNLSRYKNHFNAAVNLFTSFGYFQNDKENEAVLRQLIKSVKPDGKVVLHLIDRDWLMKVYRPVEWREDAKQLIIEGRKYDVKTKYNESQRIVLNKRTGKAHRYYHRIRLYSKTEMVALMKKCGLRKIEVYGSHQGEKFDRLASSHPFYIGTKP